MASHSDDIDLSKQRVFVGMARPVPPVVFLISSLFRVFTGVPVF